MRGLRPALTQAELRKCPACPKSISEKGSSRRAFLPTQREEGGNTSRFPNGEGGGLRYPMNAAPFPSHPPRAHRPRITTIPAQLVLDLHPACLSSKTVGVGSVARGRRHRAFITSDDRIESSSCVDCSKQAKKGTYYAFGWRCTTLGSNLPHLRGCVGLGALI